MQLRHLKAALLRASMLVLPASAGTLACQRPAHCRPTSVVEQLVIRDARFGPQIDACASDPSTCKKLCADYLAHPDHDPPTLTFVDDCMLVSRTDEGAIVQASLRKGGGCGAGRRPAGFVEPPSIASAAGWLSVVATLEAASVIAFARLTRLLEQHGAPRWAVAGARRAISDEIVHASLVSDLARRAGATVNPPVIEPRPESTILELALENVVEGEVGETFGAFLATCQARHAEDPIVRSTFARIAHDEANHALLAHRLAPWIAARLDTRERLRVDEMRADAIREAPEIPMPPADRAWLGLPDEDSARRARAQLFGELSRFRRLRS